MGIKISELPNSPTALETDIEPIVQGGVTKKLEFSVRKNDLLNVPEYVKGWNANTNTPTLVSSTGTSGSLYVVNENGATNLDGITSWLVGDYAYFNGTTWEKVEGLSKSAENIIYVDPVGGDDSTADGTIGRQFKTIAAAYAFITTASAINPFSIVIAPAEVSEAGIALRPFISIDGAGIESSRINFTSPVTLSAEWDNVQSNIQISNISILGSGVELDGTGLTLQGQILFTNSSTASIELTSMGPTFQVIGAFGGWNNLTVQDSTSIINGTIVGNTTVTSGGNLIAFNGANFGNFTLESPSGTSQASLHSSPVLGVLTIDGNNSTLNTDAGSIVNAPVIVGSPTINLLTLSDNIKTNYTPVNFTPTNDSVAGAIEGIDNALGGPVVVDNIYTANGTLASARTVTLDSNKLEFVDGSENVRIRDTVNHPSAIFALNSTSRAFLPPRMTSGQMDLIASPVEGLYTHLTDTEAPFVYSDGEWKAIRLYKAEYLTKFLHFTAESGGGNSVSAEIATDFAVKNFAPTGATSWYISYGLPSDCSNSGFTVSWDWSPSNTNTGGVAWMLTILYAEAGELITANTLLSPTILTVAAPGVINQRVTSSMAVSGFDILAAPDTMFSLSLRRIGNEVSDTFTGQAQLSQLKIFYSVNL